jgi:hypothetical protein
MQNKFEMRMDEIVNALERIANALEEQNKPKGLGNHWSGNGVAPLNCHLEDEFHLPTATSDLLTASHDGDILHKPIDKPTWYNINGINDLVDEIHG